MINIVSPSDKKSKDIIMKQGLLDLVVSKLDRSIPFSKVSSIFEILLEELASDFLNQREIRVINLGSFTMKKNRITNKNPAGYTCVRNYYNKLRFKLSYRINRKLRQFLDLDKTFGDGYIFAPLKCKPIKGRPKK